MSCHENSSEHHQVIPRRLAGLQHDVPLSPLTTLGVGGRARYFLRVSEVSALRAAVEWCNEGSIPLLVLGGGSNLLIADEGFDGLVVNIAISGLAFENAPDGNIRLRAGAGENWDLLVAACVEQDLGGVECLSGIPGLVGATPIQNVGAYGQEVSETIVAVETLDRQTGRVRLFNNEECEFAYRDSVFKRDPTARYIVTAVHYSIQPGGTPALRYPDLQRYFEEADLANPTLQQVREGVIAIRARKGMVLDEDDPDTRSAGSFFTNPLVGTEELDEVLSRIAEKLGEDTAARAPRFPAGENRWKLSSAWLIENAGYGKGHVHGNVGISSKHTLALINRGGGTAAEVRSLAAEIQQRVESLFGVRIEPEPRFVMPVGE